MSRTRVFVLVAAAVVVVDQVSKMLVEPQGAEHYGTVLTTHNAFGVSAEFSWSNLAMRVLAVAFVRWWLDPPTWLLGVIVGGVVGNMIDSAVLDGARDVVPVYTPWGIIDSNVADLAWLTGVVAALVLYMRKGVSDGQDQDQAGKAGRGRRRGAGDRRDDLPAHDPVGPSKHLGRDRGTLPGSGPPNYPRSYR